MDSRRLRLGLLRLLESAARCADLELMRHFSEWKLWKL